MYYFFSLLTGVVIALMVLCNGDLTNAYGVYPATVLIHIVGIIFAWICLRILKQPAFPKKKLPFWMYLGGVIGVITTVFNNLAFGKISLTAILALSLLAQTLLSVIIDGLGLFEMQKRRISSATLIGFVFCLAGILWMLYGATVEVALALILSFCTGISVVISRMINASLAGQTSAVAGSFLNHLAGLLPATIVMFLFGRDELSAIGSFQVPWWAYLGGVLGVVVVLLYNITVPKVSAFQLTLLSFVGQVFAGIILDLIMKNTLSSQTFIGGLLVALGIGLNIIIEQLFQKRKQCNA